MGFGLIPKASEAKDKTAPKKSSVSSLNVSVEFLHEHQCKVCPLAETDAITKDMSPSGSDTPLIYVLGEAPGREEDEEGEPFIGKAGQTLKSALAKALFPDAWQELYRFPQNEKERDQKLFSKLRFSNVVRTRPPGNKTPEFVEIESCRPSVIKDIEKSKPKLIIGTGNIPLNWATKFSGITGWRGRYVPVKIGNWETWFLPIFHPSYVNRSKPRFGVGDVELVFNRDIESAIATADSLPVPEIHNGDIGEIIYLTGKEGDFDKLTKTLSELEKSDKPIAFDIETTSGETGAKIERKIRPFGLDTKILTISISNGDINLAIALHHKQAKWDRLVKEVEAELAFFLTCGKPMIAHNASFELEWLGYFYGNDLLFEGTWGDTLAQAYILDCRTESEVLTLNGLCFQYFGIHMKDLCPVNVNNLANTDLMQVLKYNVIDSYFTSKLFAKQQDRILKEGLGKVYQDQIDRLVGLVTMQIMGLPVDQNKNKEYSESLDNDIKEILGALNEQPEIKAYNNIHGIFNPASDTNVKILLRDIMGCSEGNREGGSYSTDKETLEAIGGPVCELLGDFREASKLKATYVDNLSTKGTYLWPDLHIHPSYKPNFTNTRRLSSSSPSSQTFPKRKFAYIRGQFIAPPGHSFVSVDYGQIEARVFAMVSQDKVLVEKTWNNEDIHLFWAKRISELYPKSLGMMKKIDPNKESMKVLRQETKNKMVFPAFYGSSAKSISVNFGIPMDVIVKVLAEFWDQFAGVQEWQKATREFYMEHGYVELLTGYRRYGPMKSNAVINTPVQGTASDIVVNAMNRLSKNAYKTQRWDLHPRIEIHDDLTFILKNDTLDEDLEHIVREMCVSPFEDFDFINVPIAVEASVGPDWYNMKEVIKRDSTYYLGGN